MVETIRLSQNRPYHSLSKDDVHIWLASIEQPLDYVEQQLVRTLSLEEKARADRFYFKKDRQRFIVSHGVLRTIIGYYLNTKPSRLRFHYEEYGKPFLANNLNNTIRFNLSHSNELALFAFTLGREVGVDIEHIRPLPDLEQLVARYFSSFEKGELGKLPAQQKLNAFYACWTRKEAYLKATGQGLRARLDNFDVSIDPGEPAKLLRVHGNSEPVLAWTLKELHPAPGYAAALVVEGDNWQLKNWQFQKGTFC